jgi:hypothetical protein
MNTTEVKEEKKQETSAEKPVVAEAKSDAKSGCGCCGGRKDKR